MKKIFILIIFIITLHSCGSGGSGDSAPVQGEQTIKGIVRISGNAFVDFDLKNSGQSLNNTYQTSQYIVPDSTVSGYADYFSDNEDWYVFSAPNSVKVTINAEPGIIASVGTDPGNLDSFSSYYELAGSPKYYIKVEARSGSGNYLISVIETGKTSLSADLDFVPGEVLVKLKNNSKTALSVVSDSLKNLELKKEYQSFRVYKIPTKKALSLSSETETDLKKETINVIKELEKNPDVEYAEPNFIRKVNYIPNDYYYDFLWNLEEINVPNAWYISRGDGVCVAVLDTGLVSHEDLNSSRLVKGYDFVDMDEDTSDPGIKIGDIDYHGTHVAGIIGASMDNNLGIAGVSPKAFIMPVRIIKTAVTSDNIADGVRFAAGLSNTSGKIPSKIADIINMSFGGEGYSDTEKNACDAAVNAGAILLSSAGNEGDEIVYYPAGYSNVISVSAVDKNKSIAPYSNYGNFITLAAPGGGGSSFDEMIASLGGPAANNYSAMKGTSMATPHVSGVVALMKTVKPELDSEDIFNLINQGKMTNDLGEPGFDKKYGYGIIDAEKSLYSLWDYKSGIKVLLKNSENSILQTFYAEKTSAKTFGYTFIASSSGTYSIQAGIDLNNDNKFDGIGETSKTINIYYENNNPAVQTVFLSY
jgi:serine protease